MARAAVTAASFQMDRLGVVMEVDPSRPQEREGVLNPAALVGPMGRCISSRASSAGATPHGLV